MSLSRGQSTPDVLLAEVSRLPAHLGFRKCCDLPRAPVAVGVVRCVRSPLRIGRRNPHHLSFGSTYRARTVALAVGRRPL